MGLDYLSCTAAESNQRQTLPFAGPATYQRMDERWWASGLHPA